MVTYIRVHRGSKCDIKKQSVSQTMKSMKHTDCCYAKLKIPQ